MIANTGVSSITINSIVVHVPSAGINANLWGTSLPFSLAAGQNAIFAQTIQYNFDTSDPGISGIGPSPTNNCSVGPDPTTACTNNVPTVTITADSTATPFSDTGHVLDTGGYDSINSNPCPGGNNANNRPGSCNESLQWRLIGTSGIENPGGVPEPGSLALMSSAVPVLVGLVWLRRRRKAAK